jgi:hypothetical protein
MREEERPLSAQTHRFQEPDFPRPARPPKQTLPPFIVVGEWVDETGYRRSSPYGIGAYATIVDGVAHVFPSENAWRRHIAARNHAVRPSA